MGSNCSLTMHLTVVTQIIGKEQTIVLPHWYPAQNGKKKKCFGSFIVDYRNTRTQLSNQLKTLLTVRLFLGKIYTP